VQQKLNDRRVLRRDGDRGSGPAFAIGLVETGACRKQNCDVRLEMLVDGSARQFGSAGQSRGSEAETAATYAGSLAGAFVFLHIADLEPAAGIAERALG